MASFSELTNIWNNVKEMDVRPLREEAQRSVRIALVGQRENLTLALADQMRHDPSRSDQETQTPLLLTGLDSAENMSDTDLIILLLETTQTGDERERALARSWADSGKKVLVFIHASDGDSVQKGQNLPDALKHWQDWETRRVILGSVDDSTFLLKSFVQAVINLLPDRLLALGRDFPLFRVPVAHQLINDASFSNAAYALSTGVAEIVPVFDIPLNVADMVVLSKTQAFLVYKLGLALGLSTRWQDYVTEFGGVLGGGFFWRQIARQLIGLIPAWGIIPKVAVSYAGTYVVGSVVLQWYLTGRHVTRKQMNKLYRQAFARGQDLARNLISKVPRPRLRRDKKKALPSGSEATTQAFQVCPSCGKSSAVDARFCQYCGQPFS